MEQKDKFALFLRAMDNFSEHTIGTICKLTSIVT